LQTRNIRAFVFTALFAALFIVMSMIAIRLSLTPVPITLQTLAVILAGIFLTPRNAFLSLFSVIVLAAVGLPLFNGHGGLSYILGYTGGFIFSFPFVALLVSLAVGKLLKASFVKRGVLSFIIFFIVFEAISLLAYVPGIPWMMNVLGFSLPKALATGFVPFIVGDALKAVTASAVTIALIPYIRRIRDGMQSRSAIQSSASTNAMTSE